MTNEPNADAVPHAAIDAPPTFSGPPNPYFNWPPVGSITESQADWAALTAEWLRLRHEWYKGAFNT